MNRFDEDGNERNEAAAQSDDGIDRRNFLSCTARAGTDLLWTMAGGVPTSKLLAQAMKAVPQKPPSRKIFVRPD
jgi:3',5'-cyclic-AMP phosphodiesterase